MIETNTIQQIEQKQELYIPPGCEPLSHEKANPQIRLGIQGQFGEGKTWAAATFPNPIFLNLNRGLGAHVGRSDILDWKIYDPSFVDKLVKRTDSNAPPNRRDAVLKLLRNEAGKLTENQSLILDSLSDLERYFDLQESLEPVINSKGEKDSYAAWRHKLDYFHEITEMLMSLRCHVVLIAHEQWDRDSKGNLNGKLKPLLTGQFADKICKDFTDWFRQKASDKPDLNNKEKLSKILQQFGMNEPDFKSWVNSFPRNTIYYWQTESDDIFSGKASSLVNFPRYIPAIYDSFKKYRRKI